MKRGTTLCALMFAFSFMVCGCQRDDDPEFAYNLKSAKVIETNNAFGLELFRTVIRNEEKPNIMISPASVTANFPLAVSMPPSVSFDRPFLFAITERSSKSILYIGKWRNPRTNR